MFSNEFNKIYSQVFEVATNKAFSADDEYARYTADVADQLMEYWNSPSFDAGAITDKDTQEMTVIKRIKHPNTIDFTRDEAQDIAHIRYLGRKLIDAAKLSVERNKNIRSGADDFRSTKWYDAHPNVEHEQEYAYDSLALSPQRIAEWPYGDYVNCLGVSLGMAAESELTNTPYTYVNHVRSARREFIRHTSVFEKRLRELCPQVHDSGIDDLIHDADFAIADASGASDGELDELLCLNTPEYLYDIYQALQTIDPAFHHSVLRMNKTQQGNRWAQFDPYMIVNDAGVGPRSLTDTFTASNPQTDDASRCNEVIVLNDRRTELAGLYMNQYLDIAVRGRDRIDVLLQQYKSPKMLARLCDELWLQREVMANWHATTYSLNDMSDKDIFVMPKEQRYDKQRWGIAWLAMVEPVLKQCSRLETLLQDVLDDGKNSELDSTEILQLLMDQMHTRLGDELQYNGALREAFDEAMRTIPFAFAVNSAEQVQRIGILTDKQSDRSMEIGDAAFQLGSMCLNHYARWNKDGIINIASELARVNPSQQIWQAAVSYSNGTTTKPHVKELSKVVKSLRRSEQHPLVRITPLPKE